MLEEHLPEAHVLTNDGLLQEMAEKHRGSRRPAREVLDEEDRVRRLRLEDLRGASIERDAREVNQTTTFGLDEKRRSFLGGSERELLDEVLADLHARALGILAIDADLV